MSTKGPFILEKEISPPRTPPMIVPGGKERRKVNAVRTILLPIPNSVIQNSFMGNYFPGKMDIEKVSEAQNNQKVSKPIALDGSEKISEPVVASQNKEKTDNELVLRDMPLQEVVLSSSEEKSESLVADQNKEEDKENVEIVLKDTPSQEVALSSSEERSEPIVASQNKEKDKRNDELALMEMSPHQKNSLTASAPAFFKAVRYRPSKLFTSLQFEKVSFTKSLTLKKSFIMEDSPDSSTENSSDEESAYQSSRVSSSNESTSGEKSSYQSSSVSSSNESTSSEKSAYQSSQTDSSVSSLNESTFAQNGSTLTSERIVQQDSPMEQDQNSIPQVMPMEQDQNSVSESSSVQNSVPQDTLKLNDFESMFPFDDDMQDEKENRKVLLNYPQGVLSSFNREKNKKGEDLQLESLVSPMQKVKVK